MPFYDTATGLLRTACLHRVVLGLVRCMVQPADSRPTRIQGRASQQVKEPRMHALTQFDTVTSLPNHRFFSDRLVDMIASAQARQGQFALLLLALDSLTDVVNTLGRDAGNEVLRLAAVRIIRRVRETDFVARLDDDTFAVMLAGIERPADATQVATALQSLLGMPFMVAGRELLFTVSVGVALAPEHGDDAEALLHAATTALAVIEQRGTGGIRFASE